MYGRHPRSNGTSDSEDVCTHHIQHNTGACHPELGGTGSKRQASTPARDEARGAWGGYGRERERKVQGKIRYILVARAEPLPVGQASAFPGGVYAS